MTTFAITTLGCKVNQYESAYIIETLLDAGCVRVPFDDVADVYIVNTCTVTSKASYQSRQLMRRALRINPEAAVMAVGCYSETDSEKLASHRIATHILGNVEKLEILTYLAKSGSLDCPFVKVSGIKKDKELRGVELRCFPGRTRAFLKIQDGCESYCSYCIVPFARGRGRSLPAKKIFKQVRTFLSEGFKEIVLTGIHLGKWGHDLSHQDTLVSLLQALLPEFDDCRFRLSSIEPPELTNDLIELMAIHKNLCPHLHVPLQSGSLKVLEKMGRTYTQEFYEELFHSAINMIPDLSWGADVIVGFPGETERDFEDTYRFVERLDVAYLHVFPFSPREHTPAAHFPGQIPKVEKKRRASIMRDLGQKKRRAFHERFFGKELEVLIEGKSGRSGVFQGLSQNYIRVYCEARERDVNTLITLKAERLFESGLFGVKL